VLVRGSESDEDTEQPNSESEEEYKPPDSDGETTPESSVTSSSSAPLDSSASSVSQPAVTRSTSRAASVPSQLSFTSLLSDHNREEDDVKKNPTTKTAAPVVDNNQLDHGGDPKVSCDFMFVVCCLSRLDVETKRQQR